jgi:hypothetical protein
MRLYQLFLVSSFCLTTFTVNAEVIDPEEYILKNGYQSVMTGDDGITRSYAFTESATQVRIASLESEIAKLPKHVDVQKFCDSIRAGTKAKLIEQRGIAIDAALINYGYSGSTVACTIKFMHENNVGTQVIYSKKGESGLYRVIVSE